MKRFNYYSVLLLLFCWGLNAQQSELKPQDSIKPVVQLSEVQLQGIRADFDTPVTFSNIRKEDLQTRNLGQDIPILLNFLPSVISTSDTGNGIGYTGIRVRGSDATRVNVTINGIPYNDAESQGTFWVNLPDFASSVESYQLQRGVGTSTNGTGAFGASLNIETQFVNQEPLVSLASSYGSFNSVKNTLKFSSGLLNENFALAGRVSRITSDGYVDRASSDLDSYLLQLSYQDTNTLVRFLTFGSHEVTYQSWNGIDSLTVEKNRVYNTLGEIYDTIGNKTGFYDNQVDNYKQEHYQLLINQELRSNWNLKFALNYTDGRGYYEEYNDVWYSKNELFSDTYSYNYLGLSTFSIDETSINETENVTRKWLDNQYYVGNFGLNHQKNNTTLNLGGLLSAYYGDHFGELIWGKTLSEGTIPGHRFYENRGTKLEQSIFAKLNFQLHDRLSVFMDVQLRNIDYSVDGIVAGPDNISIDDKHLFFNPKAGLTLVLSNDSRFYFSFARANREPNRTDYENGSPIPESLNDFEIGFRRNSSRSAWQVNLYYMDYDNQLVLTGELDEVGSPIRQNVGKSRRFGLEIEGKSLLFPNLVWQPVLSVSSNKNIDFKFRKDGTLKNLGNTNISYSPWLIGSNIFSYNLSNGINFTFLSKYVSEQFMSNIEATKSKLDAYTTTDFNFSYTLEPDSLFEEVSFSLLVNNIFNAKYISNGYYYTYDDDYSVPGVVTTIEESRFYPQSGRNLLLGIYVQF